MGEAEIEKLRLRAQGRSADANQYAADFARGLEDRSAVRQAYSRANAAWADWRRAMGPERLRQEWESVDGESYGVGGRGRTP